MGSGSAPRQTATIRTVAAHAGVSKSSVSRYLQGSPRLSEEAREAIRRSIEELGYRPNSAARSLIARETRAIGVLANELRRPWFVDFMSGLGSALHDHQYLMFIGDGRLDRQLDEQLVRAFSESRVDGLVLAGPIPQSAALLQAVSHLPTVVASDRDFDESEIDVVAGDDYLIGRMAARHLIDLGHRRIVHVSAPEGRHFDLRAQGYLDEMHDAGLSSQAQVLLSGSTEHGGHEAGRRLLGGPERPSAIFIATDLAALGLHAAAHEAGVSFGTDLSVVAVDDSFLSDDSALSLTSIRNGARTQGELAAEVIVRRISDPGAPRHHQLIPPELVVRSSSAPPGV